ncbi:hypothetical protein DI272_38255 [Streptomyces sp. Act143]|uniref:hypothetical protein n=1 Tax=Streptomyces sp. Act143 TaxID=2200760 RepID=UPI000D67384A|nr:hypothetical protein [Streptomyces sp. Act143]PWI19353.1 hypothetical protein DI272_38255 [Streptomyces sp. Act143]
MGRGSDSRQSRRRRALAELREQGRYGPELREVLPAFAVVGSAVAGLTLILVWLHHVMGFVGQALSLGLLVAVTVIGVRWRRAAVRRRAGIYTRAELALLDDHGLLAAAERILRRDGWHVVSLPARRRPRLYARDGSGRMLEVSFCPAEEATSGSFPAVRAPLERAEHTATDGLIRILVSRARFSRADVRWAADQSGVRLLDGRRLQRWADGTPLDDLGLRGRRGTDRRL